MIKNLLTKEKLFNYEPSLEELLTESELQNKINEALQSLIIDLKNEGKFIQRYCQPLILFQGNILNQSVVVVDEVERLAINIKGNNLGVLTLEGSEDGINFSLIYSENFQGNSLDTIRFISAPSKFYKATLTNGNNCEIFLIESNYIKAHIYKTLELIMQGLSVSSSDSYFEKAQKYSELYNEHFNRMRLSYINDEGEQIIEGGNIKNIGLER